MIEGQDQESQSQAASRQAALPPCCNSGCTVCVLDYPELFLIPEPEPDMLAMLEMIEQAEREAEQIAGKSPTD